MKKTIILSQSTIDEKFSGIIKNGIETWASKSNFPVIFYSGGKTLDYSGNILTVPVDDRDNVIIENERFDFRAEKFISALEYCFENFDFDFLYRTTCTSYINTSTLNDYIQNSRNFKVFDGALNMDSLGRRFIGTYNCLMSRDVVEQILLNKEYYLSIKENEDLALGILVYSKLQYIDELDYPINKNFDLRYCLFEDTYRKEIVCYKLKSEEPEAMIKIFSEQYR